MSFFRRLFDRSPKTKAEFSAFALRALSEHGVSLQSLEIGEADFSLRHDGGTLYLGNIYTTFTRTPKADRPALIDRWVRSMSARPDVPTSFADVSESLLPMLRPRDEAALIRFEKSTDPFVDRPFSEDLVVSLVLDLPDSVQRIASSHVAPWGVETALLWEAAMHNLRLRSADSWRRIGDGVFQSTWCDVYDATRALLPDLLYRTGVAGRPIVMIPERNILLVMGENEPAARRASFFTLGWSFFDENAYSRSPIPYVLDGDVLVPLGLETWQQTEVDRRLKVRRAQLYADQARAKEAEYGDVFFASLNIFEGRERAWCRSVATWSPAVSLLPEADVISFVGEHEGVLSVPWADVVDVLGPLPEDPKLEPVRYRAERLPDAGQMARLAARALPLGELA